MVRTKEDFINLCKKTNPPHEILETFDGMDFVIWMNEYERLVDKAELTNVKTYSYRLTAPRLFHWYIGYYTDIHKARLKINRNWLNEEKNEQWWQERIQKIKLIVADWLKRIFYMNACEEKERRLALMREDLDERGIRYIDDDEYQEAYNAPVKYDPDA